MNISNIDSSLWESFLAFGQKFEDLTNALLGTIVILFLIIISIRWIEKYIKIDKINYVTERIINFIIDNIPSKFLKSSLTQLFNIEAETFILLPKSSARNYKHLGYQLNGINRFLEKHENFRSHIKIILIDNSRAELTTESITGFVEGLSSNKRYIIIATMSDVFDSLLAVIGHRLNDKNYRNMVKIIGTLASQSEQYQNYERYENVIRLSPPDFDEARKATSNIVTKLISSYCPSQSCDYHKANNIILVSSNSYGDAVKKSFSKLFAEHKDEFDTSTNIHVNEKDLNKGVFKFTYHYESAKGIVEDADTNYTFENLLEEKANNAINTIFIIGYEPNISNILIEIDKMMQSKSLHESEFSILISATASVQEWRETIVETINQLDMKKLVNEVNYIKIEYPKFKADDNYSSKKIYFELYNLSKNSYDLKRTTLESEFNQSEIEKIIYKPNMHYINGFIYMSLEFVEQINADWEINMLSLKEKLFHNKDRNNKDITGVKILSSGDSINHFKVKKLKL